MILKNGIFGKEVVGTSEEKSDMYLEWNEYNQ